MTANQTILRALWSDFKIPAPVSEHPFCPGRKWKFDYAWPDLLVAVEVQGGIWTRGRHTRGAALMDEWEKLNMAAVLGWRILYCQPQDAATTKFARLIKAALEFEP